MQIGCPAVGVRKPFRRVRTGHHFGGCQISGHLTDRLGLGFAMGLSDKIDNQAEEAKGKAKEGLGKATDDERLEAEGKVDQSSGSLKQAGEKVKDAFKS